MTVDPVPATEGDWTVEDYRRLEGDQRHELIQGELVVTPSPTFRHQHTVHELDAIISRHVREQNLGYCVEAPADVVLADDTVLQPDFLFVSNQRFDELYDGHSLTGPPDLVVEVLSEGTVKRDRIEKMDLYAEGGVPWLLIVDPREQFVEVFELDDGTYRRVERASDDESLTFGLFPDLAIELGEVWFEGG